MAATAFVLALSKLDSRTKRLAGACGPLKVRPETLHERRALAATCAATVVPRGLWLALGGRLVEESPEPRGRRPLPRKTQEAR